MSTTTTLQGSNTGFDFWTDKVSDEYLMRHHSLDEKELKGKVYNAHHHGVRITKGLLSKELDNKNEQIKKLTEYLNSIVIELASTNKTLANLTEDAANYITVEIK